MSTRMMRIRQMCDLMSRGPYPTLEQMQERFEVSERTIFLDLQFMRETLHMQVERNPVTQVYFLDSRSPNFPIFDLSDEEMRALKLSTQVLSQYAGSAFEQVLHSALTKIADRLPSMVKQEANRDIPLCFKAPKTGSLPFRQFWDLNEACLEKKTVQFDYRSPKTDEFTHRKFDTYRLVERNGTWYASGYCHLRKTLRNFALHRMKNVTMLREAFTVREELLHDEWLNSAFQIEVGAKRFTAKIRFSKSAARYIREKLWHPSQEIVENDDGGVTLSFIATSLEEVKRWVLFYGAEAEVIEPPELRDLVAEELLTALQRYSN